MKPRSRRTRIIGDLGHRTIGCDLASSKFVLLK
jgi:hypothetical protein